MKKYLLVFIIVLVFSSLLFGQSISIDYIVMHGSGGTNDFDVSPGETVTVRVKYDATGDLMSVDGIRYVNSANNHKLGFFYYSSDPPSGSYLGGSITSVSGDNDFTMGSNQTNDFTFTVPTVNSSTTSIQITFLVYGQDLLLNEITSNQMTSYLTVGSWSPASESAPTGWQKYLSYSNDTTTESPTLDAPLASATISEYFDVQYDQPETAYEGSVKITLTRTSGSLDSGSPHILEVE
ncbi:MAG: hypothetical protein U9P73_00170, partial [Candidatus Cloacimonadota bacterium]|nr:hypothetical protein [Candidatus Cloacimonadota bacterium]